MLRTNRNVLKMIFLGLITLGIYDIVVISKIANEINLLAQDGKHTMHYCLILFIFIPLTFGIVGLVWYHRLCNRIGDELKRRKIYYTFSSNTFWGWGFFGYLLLGIGPIIFLHKLCTASNKLNESYNFSLQSN